MKTELIKFSQNDYFTRINFLLHSTIKENESEHTFLDDLSLIYC